MWKPCVQTKQNKQFTTSNGQAGVWPSPERQGSLTHKGYLGGQTPSLWMYPLPSFFPQFFLLTKVPYAVGYAYGHLCLSQLCPLTTFCASPQPTGRWSDTRHRKGLFSAQIQNSPILATVRKVNSYLQTSKEVEFPFCHSDLSISFIVRRVEWQWTFICVVVPCCCLSAFPSECNSTMDGSKP